MTSPEPSRLTVFLSHASEDKPAVRLLYQRLLMEGTEPWFDEEHLLPGQHLQAEIERAVRHSDAVIICLSQASTRKAGTVQREMAWALDAALDQPERSIFIVPVRIEPCEIPDRLQHLQCPALYEDRGYQKLVEALGVRAASLGRTLHPRREPPVRDAAALPARGSLTPEAVDLSFREAFMEAFWEGGTPPAPRQPGRFSVSLVGASGAGKTSLAFTLTRASLKLLDGSRALEGSWYYQLPLDDTTVVVDHLAWSAGADRWREVLSHLENRADLVLFVVQADQADDTEVRAAFAEAARLRTPVVLVANKVDLLRGEAAVALRSRLRAAFGRIPLPVSAARGIGITSLRKFITLAPRMYA